MNNLKILHNQCGIKKGKSFSNSMWDKNLKGDLKTLKQLLYINIDPDQYYITQKAQQEAGPTIKGPRPPKPRPQVTPIRQGPAKYPGMRDDWYELQSRSSTSSPRA